MMSTVGNFEIFPTTRKFLSLSHSLALAHTDLRRAKHCPFSDKNGRARIFARWRSKKVSISAATIEDFQVKWNISNWPEAMRPTKALLHCSGGRPLWVCFTRVCLYIICIHLYVGHMVHTRGANYVNWDTTLTVQRSKHTTHTHTHI